jgi:sortase A
MKKLPNILAFTGFTVLCAVAFLAPKEKIPEPIPNESITITEELKQTYPVKISIESIGVNAPVEAVGILDGAMAVPTFGHNVGWYSLGTKPGEVGSSVLAGHVNWKNGEDAVFTNLKNIQIGDTVSVTNNYGNMDHFKVTKIQSYPIYADTTEIFSADDGIVRLNLITCTGDWNDWLDTHSERLVVFTEKIY